MKKILGILLALAISLGIATTAQSEIQWDNPDRVIVYDEIAGTDWLVFMKGLDDTRTQPLRVIIDSWGGDADSAIIIAGELLKLKREVITEVYVFAASGGAIIFIAGDKRIVHSTGQVFLHDMGYYSGVTGKDITDKMSPEEQEVIKISNEWMYELIHSATGLSIKQIQQMVNGREGVMFNADECINLGLATRKEN
jgi:ATP-dependent protease ClpP protease subunit